MGLGFGIFVAEVGAKGDAACSSIKREPFEFGTLNACYVDHVKQYENRADKAISDFMW